MVFGLEKIHHKEQTMNKLQRSYIESALSDASKIQDLLNDPIFHNVDENVFEVLNKVVNHLGDLLHTLNSILSGTTRDTDKIKVQESISIRNEITVIKRMLDNLPEGSVIDRTNLEARLDKIQTSIDRSDAELNALCNRLKVDESTIQKESNTVANETIEQEIRTLLHSNKKNLDLIQFYINEIKDINIKQHNNNIPLARESIEKAKEIVRIETNKKGSDGRWWGIWGVLLDEWVQNIRERHVDSNTNANEEWFMFLDWIKQQYYISKTSICNQVTLRGENQ